MQFNYQARTENGQVRTGLVEAASRENALLALQKYGLYVTYLAEEKTPFYAKKMDIFHKTGMRDVVLFARQLAIMFKSEVSLVEALRSLAEQAASRDFREKILVLSQEVEGGSSFSQALRRFPKIFNSFFVSMVKSGESSGKLSEVLGYLADHLERDYTVQARMKGALIYPAMVVTVAIIVFALMILFVLPNMTTILEETDTELPLPTRIIIAISNFARAWGWAIGLSFIGGIAAAVRYVKTEAGRRTLDGIIIKSPVVGDLAKKVYLARIAENLSTLIAGGLPIAQALEFSGQVVGNKIYQEVVFKARDGVRRGEAISVILKQSPKLFPPMFTQMVFVGEKSGAIDKTLQNVVTFYQGEVQRAMDNLLGLLEPLLVVFLGLGVAIVVAAVLLPLYKISGL
ncbi:MAG: hypothetical protein A2667_03500 [Candidatus Wildermuthbacteria bacterium RIFCSPHIGHO2_01_FULL_47_27]|uniref:Type II secretion system protein GspF domain-containing protein n=2 Tax=Candidatus Wildermuthiibacteriota TaxID=1817923 RepID=A0A1G2RPX5_9BACT|nr:MAG: Type IV pilin [Parcubacteria group bacterium GW2011_GWA2_47_9]OHA63532.1 MAG: hypothetical protein A2667_03500 [Candidatus Wildermuthbacteria bacterium RIFCSPHIGHO2_01_FULL_47_27]OHA67524.1 MAG: hypothetical protein A3D59_03855 [Candidatus Wildermuthbacteria bacterium RIFCSPHIGHO2_02_FULL_47_17]OHA74071.1 MAG: hypothetical protein A3A32_02145 [Candidatus Wildermuthbacteria bacterium RIFCSPLOWO2_01_FULL_48_35]OHA75059.1 MAG: hypothetical protein A3I38_03335 [Candidatus Wildermuthbacteria